VAFGKAAEEFGLLNPGKLGAARHGRLL